MKEKDAVHWITRKQHQILCWFIITGTYFLTWSAEWIVKNANCRSRISDSATVDLAQQLPVSLLCTITISEKQCWTEYCGTGTLFQLWVEWAFR
jgi:hypothetical protein